MLRAPADPRVRRFLLAALAIYVLTLVLIAFWPTHVDRDAGPLLAAIERLFPWATQRRLEFTANIALFVPFGLLLTLLVRSWPLALSLGRSEEHTSELQSLMRISYAVFCLKKQ